MIMIIHNNNRIKIKIFKLFKILMVQSKLETDLTNCKVVSNNKNKFNNNNSNNNYKNNNKMVILILKFRVLK